MSFTISCVDKRKKLDEYVARFGSIIAPTEEFLNKLPLPKTLKIRPSYAYTDSSQFLNAILDFQTRPDDVFVCSIIKCGTSWTHTIVWLLTHNLDYQTIKTVNRDGLLGSFNSSNGLENRVEQLMTEKSLDKEAALKMAWYEHFDAFESPRVIKTFFPVYFLPTSVWTNQNKLIYVHRNVKDAAVSESHFLRAFCPSITFDGIVDSITSDNAMSSPRSDHILNFWKIKDWPNVLFVAYEDLVREPLATIKQMSEFLGRNYTDDQLNELTQFVSFDNMKTVDTINREKCLEQWKKELGSGKVDNTVRFMRKGKVGSYRDDLNESQIKKLDDWIKQMESESDFRFKM